jgi:hypothetical protein
MPSVTNIVSAGSGWSFGWKAKKNLEVERITGIYGKCGQCMPCVPWVRIYAKEIG